MADLVIGLSKTVVEGALTKVQSAIEEDSKLRQKAQGDLVSITLEFEMMQSFLDVAKEESITNNMVKTWVKHVRDLAYDVEDCVEFVVHLDNTPDWWRRLLPSCVAPPLPLDQAVQELEELKRRVEDVNNCYRRYSNISDARSSSKPLVMLQQPASAAAIVDTTAANMIAEARAATKRQRGLCDLAKLVMNEDGDNDLQVIAMWGTGGDLGRTSSVIWKAYNEQQIYSRFTCRAWVKLMHPFNPSEFIQSLTADFYATTYPEQQEVMASDVLLSMKAEHTQEFLRQLKTKRYLIVLEDLSSMAEWGSIRTFFPNMKNGSCIIVSMQQFVVASLCTGRPYQLLELEQFSADHSVYAFIKKGSQFEGDKGKKTGDKKKAAEDWMMQHPLVGRESEMNVLRQYTKMTRFYSLQVMSVWGVAGVGKSALLKNLLCDTILNDCSLREKNKPGIFDKYAWVGVSSPFDLTDFSESLLLNFRSQSLQANKDNDIDTVGSKNPIVECRGILEQGRCLVVIDGLQSTDEWDSIQVELVAGSSDNCIIVITTKKRIAKYCQGKKGLVFNVKNVQPDDAFGFFKKKGSQCEGDKGKKTSDKKKAAEDWMTEHPLVGREPEMNYLRQYTNKIARSQVMSVWGIAGVGKSALLKNLLCDTILRDCSIREKNNPGIFDKYAWVDVSYPFNLRDFSRSILFNFHSQSLQANKDDDIDTVRSKNPILECRRILELHRCFVVIDGLQSTEEWDLIQAEVVAGSKNNCIIVVTTEESIARHCSGNKEGFVLNVNGLEADSAYLLFKQEVTRKSTLNNHHPNMEDQLHEVILKCGGFPGVIVVVAGLFASQKSGNVPYLNDGFMHHMETNLEFGSLHGLFDWMKSIILNPPDFLKPCIFYLSIFPPNHIIRRRRLIRRWIAEGYSREFLEKHAEENAEKFFSQLLEMSIFQQVTQLSGTILNDTRMSFFQVNGFIREYIVSRRMEENLVFELGGRSSVLTSQSTRRHLVISRNWVRERTVFESIDFSRLRSLTVFGQWESFFISKSMKMLRVLDLEDASGVKDDDVEKMVKILHRLKFLSLRGRHEIHLLPCSLDHLRQLQTLDVRGTSILTLPDNITKLQKLQYIRAGSIDVSASTPPPHTSSSWFCKNRNLVGVVVPRGIGKLTALHTLGVVNVAASGSKTCVKDLKKLTQLRKLGVSGINRKNNKEFFSAIKGHVHLESLLVQLDKETQGCCFRNGSNQGCLDGMISMPLDNLRSLKLYGLNDKLPMRESSQLSKLTKLDLQMDNLMEDDINFLGKLPQLCILRVKQLQDGELHFRVVVNNVEAVSFEKVKVLQIACGGSSSSLHVTFGSRTMRNLELLKVDCCGGSPSYQFSGLENLIGLKQVLLLNRSNAQALKEQLERQLAEHPNSVKL